MKVLCIDSAGQGGMVDYQVREGVTYQVYPSYPEDFFLIGKPSLVNNYYLIFDEEDARVYHYKWRFVPVSDIDETEIVRQREVTA